MHYRHRFTLNDQESDYGQVQSTAKLSDEQFGRSFKDVRTVPTRRCGKRQNLSIHTNLNLNFNQLACLHISAFPQRKMGNIFSTAPTQPWRSDARQAMESGTSCVLCGSPFDIEGDVYNIDAKNPRFRVRPPRHIFLTHGGKKRTEYSPLAVALRISSAGNSGGQSDTRSYK